MWQRVSALILAVGCLASPLIGGYAGLIAFVVCALFGVIYWRLGTSLMSYGRGARGVSAGLTALGFLNIAANVVADPSLGNLIGNGLAVGMHVATLWALFGVRGARVFAPGYQTDRRPVQWWFSPFFYVPLALIVLWAMLVFHLLSPLS